MQGPLEDTIGTSSKETKKALEALQRSQEEIKLAQHAWQTDLWIFGLAGLISGVGLGTMGSLPLMLLQGICTACFVIMFLVVVRWFLEWYQALMTRRRTSIAAAPYRGAAAAGAAAPQTGGTTSV
ncbi:hypothetical protein WJX75_006489 [Coccomyxa subellipsoidea]|uniref:Uncharacterized protein n=1 Tax=Coccomyxa subellipsoidea TaxID=248742 RepID=A0ABR2YV15_9CHLO